MADTQPLRNGQEQQHQRDLLQQQLDEAFEGVDDGARKLSVLGTYTAAAGGGTGDDNDLVILAFQDFVAAVTDLLSLRGRVVPAVVDINTTGNSSADYDHDDMRRRRALLDGAADDLTGAVRTVNKEIGQLGSHPPPTAPRSAPLESQLDDGITEDPTVVAFQNGVKQAMLHARRLYDLLRQAIDETRPESAVVRVPQRRTASLTAAELPPSIAADRSSSSSPYLQAGNSNNNFAKSWPRLEPSPYTQQRVDSLSDRSTPFIPTTYQHSHHQHDRPPPLPQQQLAQQQPSTPSTPSHRHRQRRRPVSHATTNTSLSRNSSSASNRAATPTVKNDPTDSTLTLRGQLAKTQRQLAALRLELDADDATVQKHSQRLAKLLHDSLRAIDAHEQHRQQESVPSIAHTRQLELFNLELSQSLSDCRETINGLRAENATLRSQLHLATLITTIPAPPAAISVSAPPSPVVGGGSGSYIHSSQATPTKSPLGLGPAAMPFADNIPSATDTDNNDNSLQPIQQTAVDYSNVFQLKSSDPGSLEQQTPTADKDTVRVEKLLEGIASRRTDDGFMRSVHSQDRLTHIRPAVSPTPGTVLPPMRMITDAETKRRVGATKIQKVYRAYRTRRQYKHHCIRKMVTQEIIDTEMSYVKGLLAIHKDYTVPLLFKQNMGTPVLPRQKFDQIFVHVREILNFNALLLARLDKRVRRWNVWIAIADIFLDMAPEFEMYTHYVNNYDAACAALNECSQLPLFKQFITQVKSKQEKRSLALADLLITPIQRIPRYVLLLKELSKNTTDPTHPDAEPLKQAIQRLSSVAEKINERKGQAEKFSLLLELQAKVHGAPGPLALPDRRLLLDGDLTEVTELTKKKTRHIFLFNDLVMCTTQLQKGRFSSSADGSWDFRWWVWLDKCRVGPIEKIPSERPSQDDVLEEIGIGIVMDGGEERHLLFSSSPDDHFRWLQAFEEAKLSLGGRPDQSNGQRLVLNRAVSRNFGRILFKRKDLRSDADQKEFVELESAIKSLRDRIEQLETDFRVENKVLVGLQKLDTVYGNSGGGNSSASQSKKQKSKAALQREESSRFLNKLQQEVDRHREILKRMDDYLESYYSVPSHEHKIIKVDVKDLTRALAEPSGPNEMITIKVAELNDGEV